MKLIREQINKIMEQNRVQLFDEQLFSWSRNILQ